MEERTSNIWIPVTVNQPAQPGRYLVYHYYMDTIEVIFWDGKKWPSNFNVTHWMSLPIKPENSIKIALELGVLKEID